MWPVAFVGVLLMLAANEQMALGFLAAAHDHGVRVPEDVALICFNGTTNAEYSSPGLTTIEQPIEEIAALAIQLLNDGLTEPVSKSCPVRLVRRRSCGCEPLRPTIAFAADANGARA